MSKKLAFIFPGQGSQYVGMGYDFYQNFSVAKETFQEIDDCLSLNLSKIIFEGPEDLLKQTENTQIALMAVSLAIYNTIVKETPFTKDTHLHMVAGHSLGEYSALHVADVLTLESTAKMLRVRGVEMQKACLQHEGAMAAILGLELKALEDICHDVSQPLSIVTIANDNSVEQIVISGHKSAVETTIEAAKLHGAKRGILLNVSGAFHSPLMEEAKQELAACGKTLTFHHATIPVIMNVTAKPEQDSSRFLPLLIEQVTGRVRWRESIHECKKQGITHIVEIGAGKVLSQLVKRIEPEINTHALNTIDTIDTFINNFI